jgi:hypothetical protein
MSVINTPDLETKGGVAHESELKLQPNRLFTIVAIFAMVIGIGSVLGGIAGATFTYRQAAVEDILTPDDAIFAKVPVRGPLSMYAQSDIITQHQLDRTGGLRYAQMDREVPMVDEAGQPVLDEAGAPVMGPNMERLSWIDATSLTTVLNMGIMAYALAAFAIVVGLTLVGLGAIVYKLRRSALVV